VAFHSLVTPGAQASPAGGVAKLAPPVHTSVGPVQIEQQILVTSVVQVGRRNAITDGGAVGARGDRGAVLGEHRADRRDPELLAVGVDAVDDCRSRRSSSAWPKNALAVLRISLARRSSAGFALLFESAR
jgi:hypothetical protein